MRGRRLINIDGGACSFANGLEITPFAVIALVEMTIVALSIAPFLSPKILEAILVYVSGLIYLDGKQTAIKIANKIGMVSHDKLTRTLAKEEWRCSTLILYFISFVQKLGCKGFLILDDTLIPRPRSKKVEGVYKQWDVSSKTYIWGQRIVMIIWSNGFWRIPVAFAFWHKKNNKWKYKYRTKNEIACILLKWVASKGINNEYITFDTWYSSKGNLLKMITMNLEIATKIKSNRILIYNGIKIQAKNIFKKILKERHLRKVKNMDTWALSAVVRVPGIPKDFLLVIVKNDIDGQKSGVKYLLGSSVSVGVYGTVQRYKTRWTIEVFFEDLKQRLGLSSHYGRTLQGAHHHLLMVILSCVILDYLRIDSDMTLGEMKSFIQRLVVVKYRNGRVRLVPIGWISPLLKRTKTFQRQKEIVSSYLSEIFVLKKYNDLCKIKVA